MFHSEGRVVAGGLVSRSLPVLGKDESRLLNPTCRIILGTFKSIPVTLGLSKIN